MDARGPGHSGRPVVREAAAHALGAGLGDGVAGHEPVEERPVVGQAPARRRQAYADMGGVQAAETHEEGGIHTAGECHTWHVGLSTSEVRFREVGQVFGVHTDGGLAVKRLRSLHGRWHLESDNPAHERQPVTEDVRVVGQVAWWGPRTADQ